jgi:hypothetical protein
MIIFKLQGKIIPDNLYWFRESIQSQGSSEIDEKTCHVNWYVRPAHE